MSVDLTFFKDIILEYASLKTGGADASIQLTWIQQQLFLRTADDALEGGSQASTTTMEGSSFTVLWNGASSYERAAACLLAIKQLRAQIGTPGPNAADLGSGVNFAYRPVMV